MPQASPDMEFALALLAGQRRAVAAVEEAMPAIAQAALVLADVLRAGGRLIYAGAGSPALIAVQDGAELPGTFGIDAARIHFVVAGGLDNLVRLDGAAEDDAVAAARDMARLAPLARDIVIAVSASGTTSFTLSAADAARQGGAKVIAIANRPGAPLLAPADVAVLLDTGAEALHGSTRMAAGTAQKAALGLISTLAAAHLGHVHAGHMVNVRPENAKLRLRALHIIGEITAVDADVANASLTLAEGDVKSAILIAAGAATRQTALGLLARSQGHAGEALALLRAGEATVQSGARAPIEGRRA